MTGSSLIWKKASSASVRAVPRVASRMIVGLAMDHDIWCRLLIESHTCAPEEPLVLSHCQPGPGAL